MARCRRPWRAAHAFCLGQVASRTVGLVRDMEESESGKVVVMVSHGDALQVTAPSPGKYGVARPVMGQVSGPSVALVSVFLAPSKGLLAIDRGNVLHGGSLGRRCERPGIDVSSDMAALFRWRF